MTKKRIKVRSAKAKGRNLQKYIAQKISDLTGIPIEKDGDLESRPMGQAGTDLIIRGKLKELFPYSPEMKAQESWSIHEFIKQAKENQLPNTDWILFCKRSREEPVVIMDVDAFFKLYKKILEK